MEICGNGTDKTARVARPTLPPPGLNDTHVFPQTIIPRGGRRFVETVGVSTPRHHQRTVSQQEGSCSDRVVVTIALQFYIFDYLRLYIYASQIRPCQ